MIRLKIERRRNSDLIRFECYLFYKNPDRLRVNHVSYSVAMGSPYSGVKWRGPEF